MPTARRCRRRRTSGNGRRWRSYPAWCTRDGDVRRHLAAQPLTLWRSAGPAAAGPGTLAAMVIRTMATVVKKAAAGGRLPRQVGSDGRHREDLRPEGQLRAQFAVTEVPPTGIDPEVPHRPEVARRLRSSSRPAARSSRPTTAPSGTEGNMAAVSAEGEGNRFIVIAVGDQRERVPVTGSPVRTGRQGRLRRWPGRGTVESVEAPKIDGTTPPSACTGW